VRIVIAISGASGAAYGIRILEVLKKFGVETHLIVTAEATETIRLETNRSIAEVKGLATQTYQIDDLKARVSSGSFRTDGMVVIPCSMKTLGGIASGYADNLLLRAAEVTMKEKRPLVLVVRETPLTLIHLENMATAVRAGAIILPAMPAFYHRPKTIGDLVNYVVGKVLDVLGIDHQLYLRWEGSPRAKRKSAR
jgi:4-hydroxy-3-polyprenylbenzoate decarboxylase